MHQTMEETAPERLSTLMGKPHDEGGEGDAIAVLASPPMTERLNILKGGAHNEGVHKGFHVQASEDQNRAAAKSNDNDKGRREKCKCQGSLR